MGAVSCVGGLTCVGALGMRTGIVIAATGQKQSGRNRNQEGRFHVGNLTQTAKNPSRTWAGRFGCSIGLVTRSFRPSAFAARQLVAPKETKAEAPLRRDGGRPNTTPFSPPTRAPAGSNRDRQPDCRNGISANRFAADQATRPVRAISSPSPRCENRRSILPALSGVHSPRQFPRRKPKCNTTHVRRVRCARATGEVVPARTPRRFRRA